MYQFFFVEKASFLFKWINFHPIILSDLRIVFL
jgi:hypothetical protein